MVIPDTEGWLYLELRDDYTWYWWMVIPEDCPTDACGTYGEPDWLHCLQKKRWACHYPHLWLIGADLLRWQDLPRQPLQQNWCISLPCFWLAQHEPTGYFGNQYPWCVFQLELCISTVVVFVWSLVSHQVTPSLPAVVFDGFPLSLVPGILHQYRDFLWKCSVSSSSCPFS